MIEELRKVIKRMHYPLEVMLTCVRWYAAYPLSLRHIEEMMQERGVFVDHATVHRWAIRSCRCSPLCFAGANALSARAGEWTRRTSR
jgi:transposase-like protein